MPCWKCGQLVDHYRPMWVGHQKKAKKRGAMARYVVSRVEGTVPISHYVEKAGRMVPCKGSEAKN